MRKTRAPGGQTPVSQPAPGAVATDFRKAEKRPVERKMSESMQRQTGFTSASDELRRARAVSRQDFSKLIKRKNKP
jgi:hypothetical protein